MPTQVCPRIPTNRAILNAMSRSRRGSIRCDHAGCANAVTNPDVGSTDLRYSPRGQLLATTRDGVTRTTLFDGFDNPVESGDSEDGHYQAMARLGYDGAGRNIWTASRLGIVSTMRYDTEGHLLDKATLTDFNAIHEIEADGDTTEQRQRGYPGKIAVLQATLKKFYPGIDITQSGAQSFNTIQADTNRRTNLHDKDGRPLDQNFYRGTILSKLSP